VPAFFGSPCTSCHAEFRFAARFHSTPQPLSFAAMKTPLAIIIRDGWGKNPDEKQNNTNAVFLAKKPVSDALLKNYPSTLIATSGFDVGLPEGTMGNSEVGHQNIGAGRIVDQESVAITKQVRSGEFPLCICSAS
jgi:bisphosphoglycerate-independent phosphoglycerate mutase (AlkP superfamily)